MKKLAFIVGLLSLFFSAAISVYAACIPATGFPLSCNSPNSVRCSVRSRGGGGAGALLCCATQKDCDNKKAEIQPNAVQQTPLEPGDVCKYAGDNETACRKCFEKNPPESWTAIGCIPTTPSGFISKFLGLGIGIAGGIAFLLILFSGFQIITSAGNPEKLSAGKELLSAAISGLILIIFSLFLLKLIGVNILGLPEFGG